MILEIDNLDLEKIALSGQCFRWRRLNSPFISYAIPAFGNTLIVFQKNNRFEFSCDETEWNTIWKYYFDIERDYDSLGKRILSSDDEYLKEAYNFGKGIRILKQDLWEVIVSFMISQNNNIPRIKNSIDKIVDICKCSSRDDNDKFFRFPNYDEIDPGIFDDSSLGLGYRASYLKELVIFCNENPYWLRSLYSMSYEEAFNSLLKIKGIGSKVANCICLFGLGHTESFPIDTHIKKILNDHYSNGIDLSLYPGEEGIIQQYMFFYELSKK